jgi:diguanylate cyclase (GGDEF)-like protein
MHSEPEPTQPNVAATSGLDGDTVAGAAQTIVAETMDALLVVGEGGLVRFANPAAAHLFGRPADTLVGQPIGLPLQADRSTDLEILRPDGVVIAEIHVRPIVWFDEPATLAHLRDVTDRKQAELMLLQSQQVLRAALDNLSAGIVILDSAGVIIAANRAWLDLIDSTHSPERRTQIGESYLESCERAAAYHATAMETAVGVGAVLRGEQPNFAIEYVVEGATGRRWFSIRAAACGDGWARAVLTHEEITSNKLQEFLEADKRQILELIARQHSLETVITRVLEMVHDRYPDLAYAALFLRGNGVFRSLAIDLGEGVTAELDHWATELTNLAARAAPPAIVVARPTDTNWQTSHGALTGIAACWRAPLHQGSQSIQGQLILCKRVDLEPAADDLAFVELVGQLMAIAVEQHERTRQLAHQAHHDALTGLPNRLLFEDRLRQALEAARRTRRMAAVLFIDLDRFKQINDTLGHAVGDALLVQLARRFEGCVRATDTLARRGGDEFMLVLPDVSSAQQVTRVARRLHDMLRLPFLIDGNELFVSASIGASLYPSDGEDSDTLQRSADAAMYRAKSTLRNSFQFFDASVNRAALERLQLETHLRRAIERDELALYYQPKVDRRGRLAGAEALLRWRHPELGLIPPARFIPLAEELGLIVPIGEWCIGEICRQSRQWQRRGMPPIRVAANVSALQFAQPGFIPMLHQTLDQSELDPTWLELELTESMLMGDVAAVSRQLTELRDLQLTLAIDDFGTGFSSMVYLQRLPISVLKVDRSFVGRIGRPDDGSERGIVSAIVTLGHHLQMELVAEGVETDAQHSFLQGLGCDLFQGYLFSEPLPPTLFEHLLRGGRLPGALWRA